MNRIKTLLYFLGSKTLTAWLAGVFVIYYLTAAVWSKEAFAYFVSGLSRKPVFQTWYSLLLINVAIRSTISLLSIRHEKLKVLLRLPLYIGMVLFLFSFFMSLNARQHRLIILGEGDVFDLPWERTMFRVVRVESALEKNAIRTEASAIFDYEPGIIISDWRGNEYHVTAYPPKKVISGYMHVLNFGIGPGVKISRNSLTLMKAEVALRLTPFGSVDKFEMEPYTFYISILPSGTVKKGRETAREYNLKKPRYRIEIVKGDKTITKAETDSSVSFDNGMRLDFFPPADWVLLEAVYDPFLPWFAFSVLLLAAGLLIRAFWLFSAPIHSKRP